MSEKSEKLDSTDASPDSTLAGENPETLVEALTQAGSDSSFQFLEPIAKAPPQQEPAPPSTLPANLLTSATSITWIAVLIYNGAAQSSLPWCITLAVIAIWALSTNRTHIPKHAFAASRIGSAQEGRLARAFSTTYLCTSLLFFAWFFLHGFKMPPPLVTQRQFIDIELTSFADFKDNNELVASTQDKDSQRKRSGSTDKVAMTPPVVQPDSRAAERNSRKTEESGKRALQAVAPQKQTAAPTEMVLKGVQIEAPVNSQVANLLPRQQKAETKARMISEMKLPTGWKSVQAFQTTARQFDQSPGVRSEPTRAASESMFMEESSPVELFEVVDNEGDKGLEVYQAGGRSTGGKGAPSTLQDYLKQLHKRIKRAWSPPQGDPRVAQILFRITRDGKLKSIKLLRSSGNPDSDEAAMSAITACAPFKDLPLDFSADCLDVKYTFNYKVDSLSEMADRKTQ